MRSCAGRFRLLKSALIAAVLVSGFSCSEGQPRFVAVDVWVDAGAAALAAYQLELRCDRAAIVGVEGGNGPHYADPPRYDPAALQGGRIVLAAFTTKPSPPRGVVRVARLHLLESGVLGGPYRTLGVVAAKPGGERIPVEIEITPYGE